MMDWDNAFDNMSYEPGAKEIPDALTRNAATFRKAWAEIGSVELDMAYGTGPRERLDVFHPKGPSAGLVVFVHGGYWRRFDKSYWSHFAKGCLDHGWTVAMPSYPLAPNAHISDITQSVRRAIETAADHVPGPIRLVGHSAGGHLVTRMMCDGVLPETIVARMRKTVSISGLFALEPLLWVQLNDTLQLTEEEARTESPSLQAPLTSVPFCAWVGAKERPEFLRQTRLIDEVWGAAGAQTDSVFEPGHTHFSVIDALQHADSALVGTILG